jgi:hypothetical protein
MDSQLCLICTIWDIILFYWFIRSFQCGTEAVEQQFETHDVLGYVRLTKQDLFGCDLLSIVSFVQLLLGSHYRSPSRERPIQKVHWYWRRRTSLMISCWKSGSKNHLRGQLFPMRNSVDSLYAKLDIVGQGSDHYCGFGKKPDDIYLSG